MPLLFYQMPQLLFFLLIVDVAALLNAADCSSICEEEERIVYPDELPPDPFTKENVD